MNGRDLTSYDHRMHAIRNRALRRVLDSILLVRLTRTNAARALTLAHREPASPWEPPHAEGARPRGRARLRLVKG